MTTQLTTSDSFEYIANIKRKTLKSVCKELKRFDDATHKLAVENEETLHLVVPVLYELKSKMKKEAVKYGTQNPDVCKLCNDLSRSLDDKCWSKLTWYHFAAAFLYPEYKNHESMMAMETEVDRVRLDLRATWAPEANVDWYGEILPSLPPLPSPPLSSPPLRSRPPYCS